MDAAEALIPISAIAILFLGLPWMVLHYLTKWRQAKVLTREDEGLLDDLYDTARRLADRLDTIERIVAADNPDFRPRVRSDEDLRTLDQRRFAAGSNPSNGSH